MGKPASKQFNDPITKQQPVQGATFNQKRLIEEIKNNEQVVIMGPAGTGKTYIAAGMAADWYSQNKHRKIVITRPMVPVGAITDTCALR